MMLRTIATIAFFGLPLQAVAATVNLSTWIENGFQGNSGAGTWTLGPGNTSVVQSQNGDPTVFFDPGTNAQGTSLAGTVVVETTLDDDYFGFVLGYQDGELNSSNADFWLIDWKQVDEADGALKGLSLSHVSGDIRSAPSANPTFWAHSTPLDQVQRGRTLGATGWTDNTTYTFELTFTSSLIEVFVNGIRELSYTSSDHGLPFSDGAFGFYNYSQANVRYSSGLATPPDALALLSISPVPLPASLPLLLAGIGLLGVLRRRKRS